MQEKQNPLEKESQGQAKWPFDPMQPGDHEPVPRDADEPVKTHDHERRSGGDRRRNP